MSDLLKDIKTYLINNGIGSSSTIFLDTRPESPDTLIVIAEYPGIAGLSIDGRKIQISVRNKNLVTGKTSINSIRTLLDSTSPEQIVTLATSRKTVFKTLQPPFKLLEDDKKRVVFACNFLVKTVRD